MRNVATTTAIWFLLCCSSAALAQSGQAKSEPLPLNPLERRTPDILLPNSKTNQPLTPAERQKLEAGLDNLDAFAQARLEAGDTIAAFDFWNRELRLRQALGPMAEVQALSRVGAIAWSHNQTHEVQIITQRLKVIQQQASVQLVDNPELWQELGQAYQQLRDPQQALQVYQRILDIERRQKEDVATQSETLKTIAQLHLEWFEYPQAAAVYEELLKIARTQGDHVSEESALQQLAYIYGQANQPQKALAVKQQLAEFYLNEKDITQLPRLKLGIASNYASLGQVEAAFKNYREAYASAWSLQQYYLAAEALQKLIALYRSNGQTNAALETSQILLEADSRSGDYYGMMNAYDQIGQIYVKIGDYPKAKAAFQNGLKFAQQLQYQENYFTQQIEQVSQRLAK
ncbi:MAG: tetratricopeptide repeat protein [Chroococcidiopsidaceae cyanobacterium CP_BM_ER_R8_30]|nr:tetratricopeptide repeat protein [Chroococcidiopsidaceae cyanobacterium CP_BM_ER_R8_30]